MKLIFAGTPDFAVPTLNALVEHGHQIVGVYTQPDRPAGRGRKLTASPVKQRALALGLPVFQPLNFKQAADRDELAALNADAMIVIAYGLILPQSVLDTPKHSCFNVHGSLLPRWRGAAPIQRAIAAGDTETGITIMQMDAGLDTGDMLHKTPCPITPQTTGASLHDQLASLGATAMVKVLDDLANHQLQPAKQDDSLATYAHKLDKAEARIDWAQPATQIDRQIRAFNPWPVAHTSLDEKPLRIWAAALLPDQANAAPGTIINSGKTSIDVATGNGVLRLTQIQPAGKKAMPAADYANARALTGTILS